jgi:histidinol-phosphate aminotransferase
MAALNFPFHWMFLALYQILCAAAKLSPMPGNSGRIQTFAGAPHRREEPPMKVHLPVRKAILNRRTFEAPAEGRSNKVRLDFNENTSGCSPAILRALAKLTPRQVAMYPEYQGPAKRLARYFRVRPEELLLTNGGDDALRVFFDTFVDSGTHILICEPTFPMYRYYAEIAGASVHALRYDSEMQFPLEDVIAGLREKPRVLFIANPNNPTGTLLHEPELRRILRAATDTVVVMDEAYAEFSGLTAVPWIRRYPQLFVARTFSKVAGLAALRLGAVVACGKSLAFVRHAMPPFPVNLAALIAAEAAVGDPATMRAYVREVKRLRVWFAAELQKVGVKSYPSGGNFLLAEFGPRGPRLFSKLEKQGILLRDRSKDMGPGFARITMGTSSEMQRLLRSIRKEWRKSV